MAMKTYDPAAVTVSYKGINITGYQDGTFIKAERSEDMFTKHAGSGGEVVRVQNRNKTGKVTVTLMMSSPTNDLLVAMALQDELTGRNFGAILIKDLHGNAKVESHEAWIMKMPDFDRAKESGSTVWVFECSDLDIRPGGNVI